MITRILLDILGHSLLGFGMGLLGCELSFYFRRRRQARQLALVEADFKRSQKQLQDKLENLFGNIDLSEVLEKNIYH